VAPSPRRRGRPVWGAFGALAFLVVVGASFTAYRLVLASGDREDSKVPAEANVYAAVFLEPPPGQKLALLNLSKKFPGADTDANRDKKIDEQMDKALKDLGLSFRDDVRPWLGSQISIESQIKSISPGSSANASAPTAILINSKDDKNAQAALDKARDKSKDYDWKKSTHNGVDLWDGRKKPSSDSAPTGSGRAAGTNNSSSAGETAYAIVDHTAVIGDSLSAVETIIDTDQGKHPRLSDSADYKAVLRKLPSQRIVAGYINAPALVKVLKESLGKKPAAASGISADLPQKFKDQLDAIQSAGFALTAHSDALVLDVVGGLDSSKLDVETKAALSQARHSNAEVKTVPKDAYGALGGSGLKSVSKAIADTTSALPADQKGLLQELQLTDANGPLSHLGPDYAIEVEPTAGSSPGGALLVPTDDEVGTLAWVNKISGVFLGSPTPKRQSFSPTRGIPPVPLTDSRAPDSQPWLSHETYREATINVIKIPNTDTLSPAYTVTAGTLIVASSPDEIKTLINVRGGSPNVTSSANWKAATADSPQLGAAFLYLNLETIAPAIEQALPSQGRASPNSDTAAYLKPLKSFMMSGTADQNGYAERLVLVIK
jgi:hypothetical protein